MGAHCSIKNKTKTPISDLSIIRLRFSFFGKLWDFVEAEAAWLLVWGAVAGRSQFYRLAPN
jgi:hypothetical protein